MLPGDEKESYYHNIPIGTLRIPEVIQVLRYVKFRYPNLSPNQAEDWVLEYFETIRSGYLQDAVELT